jgi:hypothetical protein
MSVLQAHGKDTAARRCPSSGSKVVLPIADNRGSRCTHRPRFLIRAESWMLAARGGLLSSGRLPALATVLLKAIWRGMHQRLL